MKLIDNTNSQYGSNNQLKAYATGYKASLAEAVGFVKKELMVDGVVIPNDGEGRYCMDTLYELADPLDGDDSAPKVFLKGGRWFNIKSFWDEGEMRNDHFLTPHGCILYARFISWEFENIVLKGFVDSGLIDGSFVGGNYANR